MKRWIACLLGAMLLCLSGCNYTVELAEEGRGDGPGGYDAATPDGAALTALDALRRLDFDTFDQYSDNHGGSHGAAGDALDGLEEKIAGALFRNLSCEAGDVEFFGEDKAYVTLQIKNTDFSGVVADLMDVFIESYLRDKTITDAEAEELVLEALQDADANAAWQTKLEAEVNREDGVWKLHLDEELIDAACGGMVSSALDLGDQLAQGIEGKIESGLEDWLP